MDISENLAKSKKANRLKIAPNYGNRHYDYINVSANLKRPKGRG